LRILAPLGSFCRISRLGQLYHNDTLESFILTDCTHFKSNVLPFMGDRRIRPDGKSGSGASWNREPLLAARRSPTGEHHLILIVKSTEADWVARQSHACDRETCRNAQGIRVGGIASNLPTIRGFGTIGSQANHLHFILAWTVFCLILLGPLKRQPTDACPQKPGDQIEPACHRDAGKERERHPHQPGFQTGRRFGQFKAAPDGDVVFVGR